MAINPGKVVVGGLASGAVLAILDTLVNGVLLADQNRAALNALNPSLAANGERPGVIAVFVGIDLVLGILVTWTYAAMRPRFGAGPRTAILAGGQVWLVSVLMYLAMTALGLWAWSYFALGSALYLVMLLIAAWIGGMVYRES